MYIDHEKCIGCGRCMAYCTMEAIYYQRSENGYKVHAKINEAGCVDCGVCYRAQVCPTEAIQSPEAVWPRSIRGTFSNPLLEHKETRVPGRGTEEMKTNEVTGRFKRGSVGVAAEIGRPGIGATFFDIETVLHSLSELGVEFEPKNPLTSLLVDKKKGRLNPETMGQKVLSAIIEMVVPMESLPAILSQLDAASKRIDTVFSVDLTWRAQNDGTCPVVHLLDELGVFYRINGKINLGLGRPLYEEA